MKTLKVLHIVESTLAGVGRHVKYLCLDLAKRGHHVSIAYSVKRIDKQFQQFVETAQDITFIPVNMERSLNPIADVKSLLTLRKLVLESKGFDIIHGHSSKGGALARLVGFMMGLPTVYTPNGLIMAAPDLSWAQRSLYTLIERILGRWMSSVIIAVCEDEKKLMLSLGLQREDRIVTIENALEDQDYNAIDTISEINKSDNTFVFGAMMRFSEQKDPVNLVRAFHIFKQKYILPFPVKLVIAGDGPLFTRVQDLIKELGMTSDIDLLGWQTETYKIMSSFDVLVLPSNYEGFSYMVLEAMAAKLPMLATNVAGIQDTLGKVPGNVVVPHSNAEALAVAMYQMLEEAKDTGLKALREKLSQVGAANSLYVREHFHQSKATAKTLDAYYKIMKAKKI